MLPFSEKRTPHPVGFSLGAFRTLRLHTKGFSPVWARVCLAKALGFWKILRQPSHSHACFLAAPRGWARPYGLAASRRSTFGWRRSARSSVGIFWSDDSA